MMRRFRLHGFLIGLFLFVVLWAWRSASTLAPGDEDLERGLVASSGTVMGEDSNAGLITLLKRSIPGKELVANCLATWRLSQVNTLTPEKENQISEIKRNYEADPAKHTPASIYQQIAEVLKKK